MPNPITGSHAITEACIGCLHGDCVQNCIPDCFYLVEGHPQLLIDGTACVDCEICVEACPEEAIVNYDNDDDVLAKALEHNNRILQEARDGGILKIINPTTIEEVKEFQASLAK